MRTIEASAKTVEEAIAQGLDELGASISDVTIDVVEEGSKGLFGLFGSRLAKVRLTLREGDGFEEMEPDRKPAASVSAPVPAPAKQSVKEKAPASAAAPGADGVPAEKHAHPPVERKPRTKAAPVHRQEEKPSVPPVARVPQVSLEKPVVTMVDEKDFQPDSPMAAAHVFLRQLTALMGTEVTITMGTDPEGNLYGYMNGDTLGVLIGRHGETLDALQYLTSIHINKGKDTYTRVMLDTENYRAKREDTLIRLANRMANRAVKTGRKVVMEPMNPYERRIIHTALQNHDGVETHSEGEDANRHVVITVKK